VLDPVWPADADIRPEGAMYKNTVGQSDVAPF